MKKYLFIVLLVGVWSCEDEISVPSAVNLPSFYQDYENAIIKWELEMKKNEIILDMLNNND